MIAGVDEAGRGPVLGPLVVAAVLAKSQRSMRDLGVDDSKKLSPTKREALVPLIREKALAVEVRIVTVQELDERMAHATLNEIEIDAFGELLRKLAPEEAYVDACDVDEARFGRQVASRLGPPPPAELALKTTRNRAPLAYAQRADGTLCCVRAEHGADAKHAVVAAASIVAKVERDRLVAELEKEYGPLGSGYASDPATQAFLKRWHETKGGIPPCARKYWETSRRLVPVNRALTEFAPKG